MRLSKLATFDANGLVHVVIECPRGATAKFKYDPRLDAFTLSRPLVDGVMYPYDWGFIPSTRADDGDPLDVLVLWNRGSYPGIVLPCRAISVLTAEQNSKGHPGTRERNDRIVAVPAAAPQCASLRDLPDIPLRTRQELEAFFLAAVALENKALTFLGWAGAAEADALIKSSQA